MKDALGHGSDAHGSGIAAAVPSTAYELAKAKGAALEAENQKHSAVLDTFPKGPIGITPDHIKASPNYQKARADFNRSFAALRAHNGGFVKTFKKEIKTERDKRYGR